MIHEPDTIAALATPTGGAVAIVRTSGPRAVSIARALEWPPAFSPSPGTPGEGRGEGPRTLSPISNLKSELAEDPHPNPLPAYRERGLQLGDSIVVPAKVLSFIAPRSATGEDVVEYHVPGSPWIASRLLERLFELGARQAEPGEFTSRAFLNGKLDLAAAEGVVATIGASNRAGLDAARQLLAGELSRRLVPLMDRLGNTLALVEVGIDFSEEEVTFIDRERLIAEIDGSRDELRSLLSEAPSLERLDHEPRIVLAGRPNAGKSSLLNVLADRQRAIVADVAGTTRDALSERVALASGFVTVIDVAGLDEADSDGSIDSQMQSAARRAIDEADHVMLVVACDDDRSSLVLNREPALVIRTKSDLSPSSERRKGTAALKKEIAASVVIPGGLDLVRDALNAIAFAGDSTESAAGVALNVRQRSAITDASAALNRAAASLDHGAEIVAAELRHAIDALGRVLGKIAPDDVLGRIFSSFCIGK